MKPISATFPSSLLAVVEMPTLHSAPCALCSIVVTGAVGVPLTARETSLMCWTWPRYGDMIVMLPRWTRRLSYVVEVASSTDWSYLTKTSSKGLYKDCGRKYVYNGRVSRQTVAAKIHKTISASRNGVIQDVSNQLSRLVDAAFDFETNTRRGNINCGLMGASAYDLHNVNIVPFLGMTLTEPLMD